MAHNVTKTKQEELTQHQTQCLQHSKHSNHFRLNH
nr:MAG TPA: hypothetical protein [Bacteriophage sp.]